MMTAVPVTIEGTSPLLFHAFNTTMISNTRPKRAGSAGNNPEEWRDTVRVNADGYLYLIDLQVYSCLVAAAKHSRGRGRASLKSAFAAAIEVAPTEIVLANRRMPDGWEKEQLTTDPSADVYLDVRGVVNPTTKGRNVRYRVAAATGWVAELSLAYDNTLVSDAQVQEVLDNAGRMERLGNGRTIGFGRFRVKNYPA